MSDTPQDQKEFDPRILLAPETLRRQQVIASLFPFWIEKAGMVAHIGVGFSQTEGCGMNIEEVPFNKHIGIKRSSHADYLLEIEPSHQHENHLDTLHGAVIFALAEASTGEFLLQGLSDIDITAVIRRSTSKYSSQQE